MPTQVATNGFVKLSASNPGGALTSCTSTFPTATLTCTVTAAGPPATIQIDGHFPDATNTGQRAVKFSLVDNPTTAADTNSFQVTVNNGDPNQYVISTKTTGVVASILIPIANCNSPCATCAGTADTCTSCTSPGDKPIHDPVSMTCVDQCPTGYFLNGQTCYKCHESCATCSGSASNQCVTCAAPKLFENGFCVESCGQGATPVNGNCQGSSCTSPCVTCSQSPTWCLSCDQSSSTPALDVGTGTCVADNVNGCSSGFFLNNATNTCELCSTKCKECELSADSCFECHTFLTGNVLDWNDYTCKPKDECSSNTYYDAATNTCPICNPVCATCTAGSNKNCLTCAAINGNQLYFDSESNECVSACRLPFEADKSTNTCKRSVFSFLNVPFFIVFPLTILSFIVMILSKIISKIRKKSRPSKMLEEIYAYLTVVEWVNRFMFMFYLWFSPKILAFSINFMVLVCTGVLAIFFHTLYL